MNVPGVRPSGSRVVDVHTHVVPSGMQDAARTGRSWHGLEMSITSEGRISWTTGGRTWIHPWENPTESLEERLATMDAMEVDAHLMSLTPTLYRYDWPAERLADLARETNEYLADATRRFPGRFQGLALLPLQDPAVAVQELEHAVDRLGLAGGIIGTHVEGLEWDDPELFEVLEAAERKQAMLLVHPTQSRFPGRGSRYHLRNVIGNPLETTMTFASMVFGGVFDRLPDLRLCLAHGGGYVCQGLGRMDHASRARAESGAVQRLPSDYARSVYFDSLTHSEGALRFIVDTVGRDRVVLGSDYPADMGQDDPARWIAGSSRLDADDRAAILGGNAERLIGEPGAGLFSVPTEEE